MRRRLAPRLPLALAVVAFHALVLWVFLRLATQWHTADRAPARMQVRIVTLPPLPPPPSAAPAATTEPRIAATRPVAARAITKRAAAVETEPSHAIETAAAASAPSPTASAVAERPLLDNEATQRAIRMAARQRGVATTSNDQLDARGLTPSQALPGAMQRAAKGDCMKGEYAGGGMGLLSVPFLAAAVIGGNCAQ